MSNMLEICIRLVERPKGRVGRIQLVIRQDERIVFDSSWLALRIKSEAAATFLAQAVLRAIRQGSFIAPSGRAIAASKPQWFGTLDDFCATLNGKSAHVEHLSGPIKGGVWFWSVASVQDLPEHAELEPKNASTATWLCELFAVE